MTCDLCPRKCRADRTLGQSGFCGESSQIRAARAALHFWEEPCISGTTGSGAVFFTGCTLHCVFCQNRNIARGEVGKVISENRLSEIFLELQEQGANNINLVTAGHFLPGVTRALEKAKTEGLKIPIVYNTSSYESAESIKRLDGLVDIYLPDLKYVSPKLSKKYSNAENYFETASACIEEMVRQTGEPVFYRGGEEFGAEQYNDIAAEETENAFYDELRGEEKSSEILMKRGTIVRHLLLPGQVEDSKRVIKYLLETYGEMIYISIMNQYTPMPGIEEYPELARKVTDAEYDEVVDYAIELGIENAFIQTGDVAEESFIPEFDYYGL